MFELPDWIPLNTWNAFLEMRKKRRRPMTPAAVKLAIRELDKLRAAGNDPKLVLEQSILNSWQGLFELRVSHADRAEVERAQRRADAHVGGGNRQAKPMTPQELAELDRMQIENEWWEKLEKGVLPVNSETVAWVRDKQQRLAKIPNMPKQDPRPKWFRAFLECATVSGAAA